MFGSKFFSAQWEPAHDAGVYWGNMRVLTSFLLLGLLMPLAAPVVCAAVHDVPVLSCEEEADSRAASRIRPAEEPCDGCSTAPCESMLACTTSLTASVEGPIQLSVDPASFPADPASVPRAPSPSIPPPSPPPQL